MPEFSPEYRCITVDQRGFGQSPDVPGGPGPTELAADALALLDHLKVERAALIGQSMGGRAVVRSAVAQPARLWAAVLTNTIGNLTSPELVSLRQSLATSRPAASADLSKSAIGAGFQQNNRAGSFLYAQILGLNPPRAADFTRSLNMLPTPLEDYARSGVPTLFITGDEDAISWPEPSQLAHSQLPGSRLLRVPGAGHSVYFERPEVFNQAVREFLATHRPDRASQ